jgi:hypothetical protein
MAFKSPPFVGTVSPLVQTLGALEWWQAIIVVFISSPTYSHLNSSKHTNWTNTIGNSKFSALESQ